MSIRMGWERKSGGERTVKVLLKRATCQWLGYKPQSGKRSLLQRSNFFSFFFPGKKEAVLTAGRVAKDKRAERGSEGGKVAQGQGSKAARQKMEEVGTKRHNRAKELKHGFAREDNRRDATEESGRVRALCALDCWMDCRPAGVSGLMAISALFVAKHRCIVVAV